MFPNNKKYIGITNGINKRKTAHKSRARNNYKGVFYNAIRKYGWDSIRWEIADGYKDWNELCELEIKKIAEYKTQDRDFGYNITPGGNVNHGFKHTEEWKQMMSERMSGENSPLFGRKLTKEQREHLSRINSGDLHPRYGKKITEEQKKAMNNGFEKYCYENGHPWVGRKHTNESKDKISKANSGKNNGMYRKKSWNHGKKNPEWSKKMSGSGNPMYGKIGENHHGAKLNYEKAENIREKYKTGLYTYKKLSEEFNISVTQIGNIVNNRVWVKEDNNEKI